MTGALPQRDDSLRRAGCVVLGMVLAALAAEAYVRSVYSLSVTYEPGIGYVNAPGVARWGMEGLATTHWSAHGARVTPGAEVGASVLVLGDSFTEALMVSDEEAFPAVAQSVLNADTDGAPKLKLINAGRSTMSVADYIALAPRYRELFHPAWTVLEIRASDLENDAWGGADRTRFVRERESHGADGQAGLGVKLVVPPKRSGLSGAFFEARQKSMLLGYGAVRVARLKTAAAMEPPLFQASRPKPPSPPSKPAPVEEELDLLSRAWDHRLTILFLPLGEEKEAAIEARVLAWCARDHVSCISARERFAALKASGVEPCGFFNTPPGEGHLNAEGHAVGGRLLGAELHRLRTIEPSLFVPVASPRSGRGEGP